MAESEIKFPAHPVTNRILHTLLLTSILILCVTGFYIHKPWIGDGGGFLMSLMRGTHFLFAAVLIVTVIFRIVRMFAGREKDWSNFIPNGEDMKLFGPIINYYARLRSKPIGKKRYNPLQMLSYCLIFVLAIFQIVTGFALLNPQALGGINYGIVGNELNTRIAHYIVTWIFILFVIIHVYLSIRESRDEMKEMHLHQVEE